MAAGPDFDLLRFHDDTRSTWLVFACTTCGSRVILKEDAEGDARRSALLRFSMHPCAPSSEGPARLVPRSS